MAESSVMANKSLVAAFYVASLKHFSIKYPGLGLKVIRLFVTAALTRLREMILDHLEVSFKLFVSRSILTQALVRAS